MCGKDSILKKNKTIVNNEILQKLSDILIFDDERKFLFSQPVSKQLISLLYNYSCKNTVSRANDVFLVIGQMT